MQPRSSGHCARQFAAICALVNVLFVLTVCFKESLRATRLRSREERLFTSSRPTSSIFKRFSLLNVALRRAPLVPTSLRFFTADCGATDVCTSSGGVSAGGCSAGGCSVINSLMLVAHGPAVGVSSGGSRPQCPSQSAPQQDHRRGAPRRRPATPALCEVGVRLMK
eukprot:981804-Prymnesium_polylepis.1